MMRDFYDARWGRVRNGREKNIFTLERPGSQIEFAYQQKNAFIARVLAGHFGGLKRLSMLEAGCGRGTTSLYFVKLYGACCTLLDFSHPAVALAESNFRAEICPGRFVQGDVLRLPFVDEAFDAVISIGLLEHFANLEEPIREMARVTRSAGLFVSYNAPSVPLRALDRLSRIYGVLAGHVRWAYGAASTFRPKKFRKLACYLSGNSKGPPPPPSDRYRNSYSPLYYKVAAERAGLSAVEVRAVEPFVMFRPVPTAVDALLARLLMFVLQCRQRAGWSEPYTTRLDAGRGHFLWGVKA